MFNLLKIPNDSKWLDPYELKFNRVHYNKSSYYNVTWHYTAWRELHMLEITAEEFMEKAAALKGDVDHLIQQDADENNELNLNWYIEVSCASPHSL